MSIKSRDFRDELAKIHQQLKGQKTEEERSLASLALNNLTQTQTRELSSEHFAKFATELFKLISELIHSNNSNDKIGGVTALEALIASDALSDRATLMFNLLCRGGMTSKDERVLTLTSHTLGRLVHTYGHIIGDLIDAELVRSLEWLTDSKSGHVLAALLIISQIAANAPLSIYLHLSHVLDLIWPSMQDRDLNIRLAAKDTLQICLRLTNDRPLPSDRHHQQIKTVYELAVKCLEQSHQKTEHLHGALLALNELVSYPSYFTEHDFQHVCDVVMKFWDASNTTLRLQVTSLLPALAELHPHLFAQRHLAAIMKPLLAALSQRDPTERARAFITIGKLSLAVRSHMQDYVQEVLTAVRAAVSSKSKSVFKEALICVSMLSKAVGLSIQKYAKELLQQIFSGGLSQELVNTLSALSQNIPELSFDIQLRLIDTISRALTKKNIVPSGSQSRKGDKPSSIHDPEHEHRNVILALQTVGSFAFDRDILMQFSNDILITYLSHNDTLIRREACLMCCKMLSRLPATSTTNDILTKLLETGIGDTDESIRLAIILNLDTSFDALLAQHDKLSLLFLGLYDESLQIREQIVRVLGRCAARNPAYVLPVLRKRLLELRDELTYTRDSVTCEQSARLLAYLIGGPELFAGSIDNLVQYEAEWPCERSLYSPVHHRLVDPYVDSLLRALINRAKDADPRTAASVLQAISALVCQAPLELTTEHVEELFNMIAFILQDQSSTLKRVMALKCLAVVAQFTSLTMKSLLHKSKVYESVLDLLKTDQLPAVRSIVTSVIGTFGAVESQWHRRMQLEDQKSSEKSTASRSVFSNVEGDAYARTVVDSLLRIINDPSLSSHHRQALQALLFLFDSLGQTCAQFFRPVLDALLVLIRNGDSLLREVTLQQFAGLTAVIKENVREFMPEIMLLISEYWQVHSTQVLLLIEVVSSSLNEEFEIYIPQITPYLLALLKEPNYQRLTKIKALHTIELLNSLLTRQMYVILPAITSLFTTTAPHDVSHEAIVTTDTLVRRIEVSRYASSIVQPLTRVLNTRPERQDIAMQLLCSLAGQMREAFIVFIPSIRNILNQSNVTHIMYNKLEERLLRGEFEDEESTIEDSQPSANSIPREYKQRLKVNEQLLRKAWNTSSKTTSEDWQDWFRRFSVELLRESPLPSVRSCLVVSDYYPLVRELFNIAFLSCWTSLSEDDQDDLMSHLLKIFHSDVVPGDILQTLLDLAEFMEDNNNPLPIDIRILIQLTERCRAYAKSLHYLEAEAKLLPTDATTVELLIGVYNKLGLPEAANGILKYARVQLKESWYERLGRWEKALEQLEDQDASLETTLTRVRCLKALGEWQQLSNIAKREWPLLDRSSQEIVSPSALAASWALQDWEAMHNYVQVLPASQLEGAFYRAVLHIHDNEFNEAHKHINVAQSLLGPELKVLLSESYQRAYHVLVRLQQLTEMTEVIDYKLNDTCNERQTALLSNWTERLKSCERDPDVWHQLLSVRSLAVDAHSDTEVWLKFAALCRKNDRQNQAHAILQSLLGHDLTLDVPEQVLVQTPKISFAFTKLLWTENRRALAFKHLQRLVVNYQGDHGLQARMLVKLGEWQVSLQDGLREDSLSNVLTTFKTATELDEDYQQGWHAWAMINFDAIAYHENQLGKTKDAKAVADSIRAHLVPAVSSFFRAISLGHGNTLQDTLRLLTLWFKYGASKQVEKALLEGFEACPIETWLQVIPQLIARVHTPVETVRRLLHDLIVRLGREHPQALLFPLTVANKSPSQQRVVAARQIIERMRTHSAKLLDQAQLVSDELIRVGYLWPELCLDSIKEAHIMLATQDIDGALDVLGEMHGALLKPQTHYEVAFLQEYGQELDQALAWCQKFANEGRHSHLNSAWSLYKHVYDRIHRKMFKTLELNQTSPQLFAAHDLELAVPGSYKPHRPITYITKFQSQLQVFSTKQRPRKLALVGSNGTQYNYLLKSREDLRLDERVMQFIRLVNTLLKGGHKTRNKKRSINTNKNLSHLAIAYYAVVPLSPDSGLIGWVPHSDTINQLILDHRNAHNISFYLEHHFIAQSGDYDTLTPQDKYKVLKRAFENTEPRDLAQILWSKSPSSEVWLERRTNFTRSLAVMSMVGYVLGLGDRHLSNIMLDRYTGQVIHIDFGDCFEVAMQRDRFAETVPFRLTRMFVNAMEVSGVEGIYRATCETVMTMLREHKESLMAVLEAFVYDPLINWRLMDNSKPLTEEKTSDEFALDIDGNTKDNFSLETSPGRSHERRSKSLDLDDYSSSIEDQTPEQNNVIAAQVGALNQRALAAINRVNQKLSGREFVENTTLDVSDQVTRLIQQATSLDNLCQMFSGWCPYW